MPSKCLYVVLVLLAAAYSTSTLTSGEEEAIFAILTSIPSLAIANPPWSFNATLACASPPFYGIECTDDTDKHILKLRFDIRALPGSIPSEINKLLWLEELSILNACLSPGLPKELGLENLVVLELTDSAMGDCFSLKRNSTELPAWTGTTSKLERLTVRVETLKGSLDNSSLLLSLSSLQHLDLGPISLSTSSLNGTIPPSMPKLRRLKLDQTSVNAFPITPSFNWPDLEELSLVSTKYFAYDISTLLQTSLKLRKIDLTKSVATIDYGISTNMPNLTHFIADYLPTLSLWKSQWNNMPNLYCFSAANSGLFGRFPDAIGDLKNLTLLDVSNTNMEGTIPDSIANCPLQRFRAQKTSLAPWLPAYPGRFPATLKDLDLSGLQNAAFPPIVIPEFIGSFVKLNKLRLNNLGLNGTLPPSMSSLLLLDLLDISNNALEGPLIDIEGIYPIEFDVHSNRFTGTIPSAVARRATHLRLSGNFLSGTINPKLLSENTNLRELSIAHNQFSGPLPPIYPPYYVGRIDASGNNFNGSVPTSYCHTVTLLLQNNQLVDIRAFLEDTHCTALRSLHIGNNHLWEALPDLRNMTSLHTFSAPTNRLNGSLPLLSNSLLRLDLSDNELEENNLADWYRLNGLSLVHLDLSGNPNIVINSGDINALIGPRLQYLSLARIPSPGVTVSQVGAVAHELKMLDLSGCALVGTFPSIIFRALTSLKISSNYFDTMELSEFSSLATLDMSHFDFEVSQFSHLPTLTSINARQNQLFGALTLDNLFQLQSADFSQNRLTSSPDLTSIGALVDYARLRSINISHNHITPYSSFNTLSTGLGRTALSAPSRDFPLSVTCYELSFRNQSGLSFVFDESLFSYLQCDCNQNHFGLPPFNCIECPSHDHASRCGAQEAVIDKNSFVYTEVNATNEKTTNKKATNEKTRTTSSTSSSTSLVASNTVSSSSSPDMKSPNRRVITETCLITALQILSQQSNCKGITLNASDIVDASPDKKLLALQCRSGSEGRLCSRCMCKPSGEGKCFFPSGASCKQCSRVFALSASLPFAFGVLLVIILIFSAIMALALRGRRKQSLMDFSELPLWKRLFYRALLCISLGYISILITFLQMLVAFTEWDAYLRVNLLSLLNANGESLGIRCLFPFLADPQWDLLSRIAVPFVGIAIVALTVTIGNRIVAFFGSKTKSTNISELESTSLLAVKSTEVNIEYPALALATSFSVSVIKFFYFGTALSAHEYLFSVKNPSGTLYSQNQPWMLFSAAKQLIWMSIPAILIFDLIIPLLFVIICYRIRNSIKSFSVRIYYGSIFDSYRPQCFWWEIINILKKLSIALILKALPASDAIQSVLVVTILAIALILQQRLNPWVRTTENIVDGVGSLILIASLLYSRNLSASHSDGTIWYLAAVSIAFAATVVGIIIYETVVGKTDYEKRLEALLSTRVDGVNDDADPVVSNAESLDEWSTSSDTDWAPTDLEDHDPFIGN